MERQRGVSLIEVMISLLLVVLALLGMMASLSSATVGSASSSRFSQAQARAQSIVDAIRAAPPATLACLVGNQAPTWASTCEQTSPSSCVTAGGSDGGAASPQTCIFTTTSMSRLTAPPSGQSGTTNQSVDRSGQQYSIVYDSTTPTGPNSTFVQTVGPGGRVYDIQVTIGWNDDGTPGGGTPTTSRHMVTLRTGVFQ